VIFSDNSDYCPNISFDILPRDNSQGSGNDTEGVAKRQPDAGIADIQSQGS
jgi:hypothetical protein